MAEFGISADDLRRLARLVEENGLSELRYEEGDLRVTLRTAAHRPPAGAPGMAGAAPVFQVAPFEDAEADYPRPHAPHAPHAPSDRPGSGAPTVAVEAPVMGIFYRAPAPGAPHFVEVGDEVEVGQAVGLIEAMKVFSEVLAEVAGRVREIPAKSGGMVQPGDALVVLEVSA